MGGAEGVSVDRDGNICTGGTTTLSNFPVKADAWRSTHRGNCDGYICVFSKDLTRLICGTYLRGTELTKCA